jgi:hypothetical protein
MSEKEKTKLLLHDAPELTSLLADLKAYMKLLREAEILIHTHTLYIYMYIICIYIYCRLEGVHEAAPRDKNSENSTAYSDAAE